jgi:hypothetical protein
MKLGMIIIVWALLIVTSGNHLDPFCTPPIHLTDGLPYTPALMSYAHKSRVIVGEPVKYGLTCHHGAWYFIAGLGS